MALCTGFLFCHVSKSQGKTWSSVAAAFIHHSMCSCFRLQLLLFDQETGCIFRWPLEFHKVVLRVSSMVTHAAVNLLQSFIVPGLCAPTGLRVFYASGGPRPIQATAKTLMSNGTLKRSSTLQYHTPVTEIIQM